MRKVLNRNGFTLVELLVVMGIIGILMALLFPAIGAARKAALKAQAQTEVRAIATAIEAYFNEYGFYPIPDNAQGIYENSGLPHKGKEPVRYGTYYVADVNKGSEYIIKILTNMENEGAKIPATYYKKTMNKKGNVYLEAQSSGDLTNVYDGVFLDPWGEQYQMVIDTDYDGKVEFFSGAKPTVTKGCIVYSVGPDPTNIPPNDATLPSSDYPDFVSSSFD